jgi:3-hydroxyisobutyrate dehydrogenase-like beta-hydroxyacid dehydrogenase
MKKVAFFGLGNMGLPIALNLAKAGLIVKTAVHHNGAGAKQLEAAGGIIAKNNVEAVSDAEVVFTIIPNDAAVEELLLNPEMIAAIQPGTIIVEMTSCSANAVQKVARAYAEKQVQVVDAPVTGGVKGAAAATMTMIVGCTDEAFDRGKPLLEMISGKQCRVGAVGDGKKVKSLNNLMGAANALIVGEAVRLVKKNHIDPDAFYHAISNGSGNSTQFQFGYQKLIDKEYTPTFALSLMTKDVGLAMELAEGLHLPFSELTQKTYQEAMKYADEDYFAATKIY